MRPPADEPAIETPLVLLILILVAAPLIFFGFRYEMKVRADSQAQAKRETTYQAALRSYSQTLKSGMKRKAVEDYLRLNKIEFLRLSLDDDITKIGEDEPRLSCGPIGVYVRFQFTGVSQRGPRLAVNDEDTLDEIKIFHWANNCL
jgi:hypothetical protein